MCTAIAHKGKDLLYGFNLDIDPAVWHYAVYKSSSLFAVGITVGKTTYYVHGVNKNGCFGNVPYMNGERLAPPRGMGRARIDLISDRYLRGKYSFETVEKLLCTKAIVNPPAATMHSLIGSGAGELLIVEPGYGWKRVDGPFAVLANFPVLTTLPDYSAPFYGKERYDRACSVLREAGEDFSTADALRLLYETRQEGQWATRVSFVYSRNENAVYYFPDGDISRRSRHTFA